MSFYDLQAEYNLPRSFFFYLQLRLEVWAYDGPWGSTLPTQPLKKNCYFVCVCVHEACGWKLGKVKAQESI